jgi:isopentenyldiphosphate isomerase
MEYWDVLNSNRNKTGKVILRGDTFKENEYHLIVHVWIKNSKNQFVISKRKNDKYPYPGLWECTGGSAVSGDDSLKTALKEVKEELGIDLDKERGKIIYQYKGNNGYSPHFVDVWVFNQEVDKNIIKCQETEVEEAKMATREEVLELLKTNQFVPDCGLYLDKIIN